VRCWKSTGDIFQDKILSVIMEINLMFQNTACGHTKHSWICTKILSRNLLLIYCNVLIRNLKIMPQIWKRCCEYNNVSDNVNIICTKTIVPDYNAYKSNCRSKVSCTLDKIYLLTTHINVVLCARKSNAFFAWWIRARHDHYNIGPCRETKYYEIQI
jgi:hypothetical protein